MCHLTCLLSSSLGSQWTRQPCPETSSLDSLIHSHSMHSLHCRNFFIHVDSLLFCSSTKTLCLFSQSHSQYLPTEEVESGNDIHYRLHWSSCWEWLLDAAGVASYPGLFFFSINERPGYEATAGQVWEWGYTLQYRVDGEVWLLIRSMFIYISRISCWLTPDQVQNVLRCCSWSSNGMSWFTAGSWEERGRSGKGWSRRGSGQRREKRNERDEGKKNRVEGGNRVRERSVRERM